MASASSDTDREEDRESRLRMCSKSSSVDFRPPTILGSMRFIERQILRLYIRVSRMVLHGLQFLHSTSRRMLVETLESIGHILESRKLSSTLDILPPTMTDEELDSRFERHNCICDEETASFAEDEEAVVPNTPTPPTSPPVYNVAADQQEASSEQCVKVELPYLIHMTFIRHHKYTTELTSILKRITRKETSWVSLNATT